MVKVGDPRDAMRFLMGVPGVGRVAGVQHVSGLEEPGLPIFVTTFDPKGAQWMLQWLTVPNEPRPVFIWDTRMNRCVELDGTVIERHSSGGSGDGRADRYTLRSANLRVVPRPEWLLRSMTSPVGVAE